jgi:hypothetical protein
METYFRMEILRPSPQKLANLVIRQREKGNKGNFACSGFAFQTIKVVDLVYS